MRVPLAVLITAFLPAQARASVQVQPKAQVVRQLVGDTTNLDFGRNAAVTAHDAKELRKMLVDRIHYHEPARVHTKGTEKEREALAADVATKLEAQIDFATEQIVLVRMLTGGPPFGTLRHEVGKDPDRKAIVFFVEAPNVDGPRAKAGRCTRFFFAVPAGWWVQSVADVEVADRLIDVLRDGPAGRLRDCAGPEILRVSAAARTWAEIRRVRKPVIPVPIPGAVARAFRTGANTAVDADRGTITWRTWLESAADAGGD